MPDSATTIVSAYFDAWRAHWTHIENGKIASARATFDPRAIIAARQR